MFHKRNPQASFPGAQNADQANAEAAAPAQQPQQAAGYNQQRPAGVREYAYNRAMPQTPSQPFAPQSAPDASFSNTTSTINTTVQANAASNQTVNTSKNEGQTMSTPNENTTGQSNASAPRPMDIPGTMPYGRPMAPGAIGGYGATTHGAAYNPYGSGRKLIIGEGITMSGEIEHCDHLIVEGTVQATLKDAKLLDISEAGVFYGTVDIEEATIAGRFEGDINVNGRLTVKASGVIIGSIRYKELAVEAGASIEGTLSPVASARKDDNVAAADFSKGKAVAKQARDAQKSGEQLPFGEKGSSVSAAQ